MPGATCTSTSEGPSEAIASPSAECSSSRPSTRRAGHSVACGHRRHIEGGQVEARRPGHVLQGGEPLEDRVLLVAKDQEGDRHVVGRRGPEALDRVLRRALAENAHDPAVRLCEGHSDRGREPEAEPSPGSEEVAAGRAEAHLVAERERGRRRLEHHDPVVGEHVRQRGHRRGRVHRIGLGRGLGGRALGRGVALGGVERGHERLERQGHVGHDGVAHRRACGLVRVARDRHQRRPLGQRRPGDVRGSTGTPTTRPPGSGRAPPASHRADRRRGAAAPGRRDGSPGSRFARRPWPGWPTRACAAARPARPPPSSRRPSRARDRPPAPGCAPRPGARPARAPPPGRPRPGRPPGVRSGAGVACGSTSAFQSSIGMETKTGPWGGSVAGAWPARWRAAPPRRAAARSSISRADAACAWRRGS